MKGKDRAFAANGRKQSISLNYKIYPLYMEKENIKIIKLNFKEHFEKKKIKKKLKKPLKKNIKKFVDFLLTN